MSLLCIGLCSTSEVDAQSNRVTELVSWNGRLPEVGISNLVKGPSDRLWIGTEGRGLFVWNGQEIKEVEGLGSAFISDIHFWKGDLYVSTDQGAFLISGWPVKPQKLNWEIGFPTFFAGENDTAFFIYDPIAGLRQYDGEFNTVEAASTPVDIGSLEYVSGIGLTAVSEDEVWILQSSQWTKHTEVDNLEESHNLIWIERNKGLLFQIGIQPDWRTLAVDGDHFWAVSNSGLWHSYPDTSIVSSFNSGSDLPIDRSPSIQELGLVLDKERISEEEWVIATESGLFRVVSNQVESKELPVNDPFSFSVKMDGEGLWIGNGEALLYQSKDGQWRQWAIQGVTDILPDGQGNAWILDFIGNVHRVNLDGSISDPVIVADASLIGLLSIGTSQYGLTERGVVRVLSKPDSTFQLFPESLSPITDIEFHHNRLAVQSALAISLFNCKKQLKPLGSIRRGIDYFQREQDLDFVWVGEKELAINGWNGWRVWNVENISSPLTPVIDEIQLAAREALLVDSNAFNLKVTPFDLPYYSSFLQLHLMHSVKEDNRRWGFGYQLIRNDRTVAEEVVGSDVLFPALSPGNYSLKLYSRDDFSGRLSDPAIVQFRVIPPIWQQAWFIAFGIVFVLLVATAIAIYRIRRIREENRMQTELSRLEGMALRLQMNPHFIFNALDSISNFIFSNKKEEAIHYLSSFAKLIRNTLESAHEHQITLRTEVDILKSYLELESMRNARRLKYEINCDDELMEDYSVPPLIIQPYVENAVKHGLKPRKGEGRVTVDFSIDGETLKVIIQDDGIGRKASEELKSKQMGMLKKKSMSMGITQQRLELLRQAWNERVSVQIEDIYADSGDPSGTRVEVRLPLIEAEWND